MTEKEAVFILMLAKSRVCNDELNEALDIAIKALEQKPKTGHWIGIDEESAVCSCCNMHNTLYGDFCKWCGADMRKEQSNADSN